MSVFEVICDDYIGTYVNNGILNSEIRPPTCHFPFEQRNWYANWSGLAYIKTTGIACLLFIIRQWHVKKA